MKKATWFALMGLTACAPLLGQGQVVARPGGSSAGFSITLRVPSYVGSDVRQAGDSAREPGLTKTASRGTLDSWVVSLGSNAVGGSTAMRRVVVSRKDSVLVRTSRGGASAAAAGPREAFVDAAGMAEPGGGWRQFVHRIEPVARAASGARAEPELVIYEVGSF